MSNHPLNLVLRFLLELALLAIYFYWPYHYLEGVPRMLLCILLPLSGAALWAIFKVPGDPGPATVAIPGWLRLLLEATLFALAVYMLFSVGQENAGRIFLLITILHYAVSYDRIRKLLKS